MDPPNALRAKLKAQNELQQATVELTRVHHTMVHAPPAGAERLKREAAKAEARLKAAEEIVEKLAKRGRSGP